jgi:hypothetical protein
MYDIHKAYVSLALHILPYLRSSCYNVCLVTWAVLCLSDGKFKPLTFVWVGPVCWTAAALGRSSISGSEPDGIHDHILLSGRFWTLQTLLKAGSLTGWPVYKIADGLRQHIQSWLQSTRHQWPNFFSLLPMYVFRNAASSSTNKCVCVCVRARACVCVCVCVSLSLPNLQLSSQDGTLSDQCQEFSWSRKFTFHKDFKFPVSEKRISSRSLLEN